ncbi:hypothetical protein LINGRAHAP2_LOCUS29075 [Linum grandiflorum]
MIGVSTLCCSTFFPCCFLGTAWIGVSFAHFDAFYFRCRRL